MPPEPTRSRSEAGPDFDDRREWLALLAHSDTGSLEAIWDTLEMPPAFQFLRRPEIGLAMVKGRTGGSGTAFNLGEMTVTRCVVTTRDSMTGARIDGVAYVAGRDKRHAELVALFDALFQDSARGPALRADVLPGLVAKRNRIQAAQAAKSAATKVEFFTMERGH